MNEVVDNFYTDRDTIRKPHNIYQLLLDIINNKIKKDLVDDLYCFTTSQSDLNKLVIVNGTKFILHYEFKDVEFLTKLRDNKNFEVNTGLTIDSIIKNKNLSFLIRIEKFEYIFVFITNRNIPFYYLIIGVFKVLEPALSKMAKILLSEKRLQDIKNEELIKLSQRSLYVNRATKTMHYIRNRLGPITNLISLIDEMERIPKTKKKDLTKLFLEEKERAKNELKNIDSRANYLLEKSNNPFNFSETTSFSIRGIYTILKRNYISYFPDSEIIVAEGIELKEVQQAFVLLNEEGFEIFLADWLNNIKKYKKLNHSAEFKIVNDELYLVFINDFSISLSAVNQMISDLMSNDRNEIMKRTTHGLYQIKTTLEEMLIPFKIELNSEKDVVIFELRIKINQNEDSNIRK